MVKVLKQSNRQQSRIVRSHFDAARRNIDLVGAWKSTAPRGAQIVEECPVMMTKLIDRRQVAALVGSRAVVDCADFPPVAQTGPEGPRWALYDVEAWMTRQVLAVALTPLDPVDRTVADALMRGVQIRPDDADGEAETRPGE